jgi:hypothetical protein
MRRAGPVFVTKDAMLLDWLATPGGEYCVLGKGSSQWTCLPAFLTNPRDKPGCFERAFRALDSGRPRRAHAAHRSTGIAYMYVGAWMKARGRVYARTW